MVRPALTVRADRGTYSVYVSSVEQLPDFIRNRHHVVIIDKALVRLYPRLSRQFAGVPHLQVVARESNKTMRYAVREIIPWLLRQRVTKSSVVVTIGGGITQDVVAFACSILFRGIPWLLVPTTLLAQGDSCIGSKTSINHDHTKNSIGTFYPPQEILIDPSFLKTLSELDIRSGLGEIVKVHCLKGTGSVHRLRRDLPALLRRQMSVLGTYTMAALAIKKYYIERDEYDEGIRNVLNYGHCYGHALEAATGFHVPHGMAVLFGMGVANELSRLLGLLPDRDFLLMDTVIRPPLLKADVVRRVTFAKLEPHIKRDKKNEGNRLVIIVSEGCGKMRKYSGVEPRMAQKAWDLFRSTL